MTGALKKYARNARRHGRIDIYESVRINRSAYR
jgi:hypothetical protein